MRGHTVRGRVRRGLAAGVSVELRTLLPNGRRRRFEHVPDTPADAVLYQLQWRESHGSSSTEWLECSATSLLGVLEDGAGQAEAALARIAEDGRRAAARQAAYRARMAADPDA